MIMHYYIVRYVPENVSLDVSGTFIIQLWISTTDEHMLYCMFILNSVVYFEICKDLLYQA